MALFFYKEKNKDIRAAAYLAPSEYGKVVESSGNGSAASVYCSA